MVIDGEGGDLLHKLEKVDSGIQKSRLKFALEVDIIFARIDSINILGNVDEGHDVNCELPQDRTDDIEVEDVWLRAFLGKTFNGLWEVRLPGSMWQ